MGFPLNDSSKKRLVGVHPDLVKVVKKTAEISSILFIVTEGMRTVERQKELLASGKSTTMKSRHLTGCAVDLAVWEDRNADKVVGVDELSWKFPLYAQLAEVVKAAAKEVGVPIEWGGDWASFKDGPHFQLPWKQYP